MKIFLAALEGCIQYFDNRDLCPYVLASFNQMRKGFMERIAGRYKEFMLDSGAFSFIQNKKSLQDLGSYIRAYIDFINKHDVQLFFELDIDKLIPLSEVETIRALIEKETGKKTIPVWHHNRGRQYWIDSCKSYPYVAIGGIANKSLVRGADGALVWMAAEAHRRKAKMHALGYTPKNTMPFFNFDSTDSSSWVHAARSGIVYTWDGTRLRQDIARKHGKRGRNHIDLLRQAMTAWTSYVKYVDGKFSGFVS